MKKVPLAIAATALLSLCVFADQARLKNGDQSRGDIIRSDGIRTLTFAQSDEIAKHLGLENHSSLTDSKIASGLREALQVGANDAVKLTSKRDGYFGNDAIKILMPDNLHTVEKGLRALGYGPIQRLLVSTLRPLFGSA